MEHKIILKNTLFQIAARSITSLLTFLTTLLIARNFGAIGYGDFIKITTFVGLFYLVVDFGLNAIFLQKDNEENINFKDLFYLRLILSSLLFFIVNAISFILPFNKELGIGFSPTLRIGIFIFSFSIFLQGITLSSSVIFQRRLRFDLLLISTTIGSIITFLLTLFFIHLFQPLHIIVSAFVIGGVITSAISLFLSKEKIFPIVIRIRFIKSLITGSMSLGLMLIFNLIYFRIDIFLLSFFKSTTDVGIYGIAQRGFDFLIALPLFLSNALYPGLLQNKNNYRNTIGILIKYLYISVIFSLLLIIVFWFLSPLIILVKEDFVPAIVPFRILLISLPLFFATSILQWTLISQKQQKFLMYVYLLAGILNISLNFIFIPTGSYIASAIITDISEGIVLICLIAKLVLHDNFHEVKS